MLSVTWLQRWERIGFLNRHAGQRHTSYPVCVRSRLGSRLIPSGTVKWFNPTKGYGFIQPQGGGKDVFVHISAVERAGLSSLMEGQALEFELVSSRGKTSAENLKVR